MKLGRIKSDPDQLRMVPLLTSYFDPKKMAAPPLARYWSSHDGTPFGIPRRVSMFKNDVLGDCTCAALAHQDQLAADWNGISSSLLDVDVVNLYKGSGYDPNDPSSDRGWSNISAARAALKTGWLKAIARFDATSQGLLKIVINEFGSAYVGIDLPLSAQDQLGQVWDVAPEGKRTSRYEPNTWGGHAVVVVDCDAEGVTLVTWGKFQRATWAFVKMYFDSSDGIACLNRHWVLNSLSPSGLRLDELMADLARLAAWHGAWL